jgi:hypothetical protein
MLDTEEFARSVNRRSFLKQSACGVGSLALASLLARETRAAAPLPHFAPKAKRVIHLCMAGGPSHLETLDWKPELRRLHGQPFPESFTKGQQLAQLQNAKLLAYGPQHEFQRFGKSGQNICGLFEKIGSLADDICIVRSMVTEQINHDTAHAFMNSGSILKSRPSMGSWLLYGLGSESQSLPGFVVLLSVGRGGAQPVSARQWASGFLPGKFQGVPLQTRGDAVHYVGSPEGVCQSDQRLLVEEIQRLNGLKAKETGDREALTRISQYELAFQMQASVPELTDLSREKPEVLEKYGIAKPGDGSFASNCLMARRLAERGVRFIQLYHRGWDHHGGVKGGVAQAAKETDRATWALISDLKERGMLDDTLILWGGEFGRTPMGQGDGRDHHINAFSMFLCGGGVKGGMSYGNTDELGYKSVENVVTVHDLHATMLAALGIDHEKFSVKFQGLDAKLTGVEPARVVKEILR